MNVILVFSIILIILGLLKPKSIIIAITIFLFMWLLMGWNTDNPDFYNYFSSYNNSSGLIANIILGGGSDFGYSLISVFIKNAGFDYYEFRILISFVCLYLIYNTVMKFSLYPALVSICYFVFIFALDVIQFRNFIAASIVIFAIRFLFKEGKKNILYFSFFVLIASTIHSSSLFYFLLILLRFKISWKSILIMILIAFSAKSILFNHYSEIFSTNKLDESYKEGISNLAFFSIILVHLLNVIYMNAYKNFSLNKTFNSKSEISLTSSYKNMDELLKYSNSNIIPSISLIVLILIPLYIDNLIYTRIFRNLVILNFIFITNHTLYNPFKLKLINNLILLIYGSFFFIFFLLFNNGWEKVILPIFLNNFLTN